MKQKDEDDSWQPFSDWYKRGCHVTAATVNEAASSKASETTENSDMKDVEGPCELPVDPTCGLLMRQLWAKSSDSRNRLTLESSDVFNAPRKATNTHNLILWMLIWRGRRNLSQ